LYTAPNVVKFDTAGDESDENEDENTAMSS